MRLSPSAVPFRNPNQRLVGRLVAAARTLYSPTMAIPTPHAYLSNGLRVRPGSMRMANEPIQMKNVTSGYRYGCD